MHFGGQFIVRHGRHVGNGLWRQSQVEGKPVVKLNLPVEQYDCL